MGSVCFYKEDVDTLSKTETEKDKEAIQIKNLQTNKQLKFQFTTDKLIHVSADLLILFMDQTTNLKRNDHFLKLPIQGTKLEEHLLAFQERHKLSGDKFVTFNIIIPTLNFNKVSIVFCDTWRQNTRNHAVFKQTLKSYFDSISKENYKNIAITEFTSQLGIHLQKGVRGIMQEIIRMEEKPELIQFICLSEESKIVYLEQVNGSRDEISQSFTTTESNAQSDYF